MSMKLFVGNLPANLTSRDLTELFAQVGTVNTADVIQDRITGRSRGFGFVEMASINEAENAIAQLDGHAIDGNNRRRSP